MRRSMSIYIAVIVLLVIISVHLMTQVALPYGMISASTNLPIGDGKISNSPIQGSVWSCGSRFGGGGAHASGNWIKPDQTFDLSAKPLVDGNIVWPNSFKISEQGNQRIISSNDLPSHPTGKYPISSKDDAYQYDRNPNTIEAQNFQLVLPKNPTIAVEPSCVPMGPIGILLTGSVFFNALDNRGEDALAHEIQDHCQGHPERNGTYHYHSLTTCLKDTDKEKEHSSLVGYAFDGFGIYGKHGENGQLLSNADLDECHGHTHLIRWDGKMANMYHYHATWEYPYTVGCYRGQGKHI
jgi:hypothetical protein